MIYKSSAPEIQLAPLTSFEFIFGKSDVSPNTPILIDVENPDNYVTFGGLKAAILKFGAGLKRELNIQKGDVVALVAPNVWEYGMVMHGTAITGATFAALDFSAQDAALIARNMTTIGVKYLIVHPSTLALALKAAQIVGLPKTSIFTLGEPVGRIRSVSQTLLNHNELCQPIRLTPEEFVKHPAFLYFTSGTMGAPKAVTITHKMAILGVATIRHPALHHPTLSTVIRNSHFAFLCLGKFYHMSSFLFVFHGFLKLGIRTYMFTQAQMTYDFESLCKYIQKYRITDVIMLPYIVADLARNPIVDRYDLSSVMNIVSTGSGVDMSVFKDLYARLQRPLLNAYGMTEMFAVCHPDPTSPPGTPGKLCPGVEAKLIDQDGRELGAGEMGELCLRGPGLTPGYYNNPEATAKAIDKDGFYHTGDLCRILEDGTLVVYDRLRDQIKYRGNRFSPKEFEASLMMSPEVSDCAVIGVTVTKTLVELPVAYITLTDGVEPSPELEKKLLDFAHARLPPTARIEGGIRFLKEMPRTAMGKIQKRVLREMAEREFNMTPPSTTTTTTAAKIIPETVVDKLRVA